MGKKTAHRHGPSQIASVEDELAAIAEAYNLELDHEVQVSVEKRRKNKKQRKACDVLQVPRVQALILPEGYEIRKCSVPGCSCRKSPTFHDSDSLKTIRCEECSHSMLQHRLKKVRDPQVGGYHSEMIRFIRLLRISSSLYQSNPWRQLALSELKTRAVEPEVLTLIASVNNLQASRDEIPIRMAILADKMYFQVYYSYVIEFGRNAAAIPSPVEYFSQLQELKHEKMDDFVEKCDFKLETKTKIELLQLLNLRFQESIQLIYDAGIGMKGEMDRALNQIKKKDPTEIQQLQPPPAFPLLQLWRDNCRDWFCHLYAYATPNEVALQSIAKYSPIIEMGAGTGYWCSLLQERGVQVQAFDKAPPADEKENEFHGQVPPFLPVHVAGPQMLAGEREDQNLLLCYPPPGDPMARDCLRYFKGKYVLYVGEWQGDTADREFEVELQQKFHLIERVELPNWANTAYALTIWSREEPAVRQSILACDVCASQENLKRCRLCRDRIYCSEKCAAIDGEKHQANHTSRFIFLQDTIRFESRNQFQPISNPTSIESSDYQSKTAWKALQSEAPSSFNFGFQL